METSSGLSYGVSYTKEIMRLVEEAGHGLAGTVDYAGAVRAAVRSVVPVLSDFAVVVARREGEEDRLVVAHVDLECGGGVR